MLAKKWKILIELCVMLITAHQKFFEIANTDFAVIKIPNTHILTDKYLINNISLISINQTTLYKSLIDIRI